MAKKEPVSADSSLLTKGVRFVGREHFNIMTMYLGRAGGLLRDKFGTASTCISCLTLLVVFTATASIASAQGEGDFDQYSVRISGFWLHSSPRVSVEAAGHNGLVDFNRDFGFNDYSTGVGKLDWKFTRKNHLYVLFTPFTQSRLVVLNRTVTFRGQTFSAGLTAEGKLRATLLAPGYQYDIIRRRRGHIGIAAQIDFFDTKAILKAVAQVTSDGVQHPATSSEASLLVPLPVAGPEFRLYLTPRIFVEGNFYGMYLFGYGNFVSTAGDLGFSLSKHLTFNVGYGLASRLQVNTQSNSIGMSLRQQGPLAGMQVSF